MMRCLMMRGDVDDDRRKQQGQDYGCVCMSWHVDFKSSYSTIRGINR